MSAAGTHELDYAAAFRAYGEFSGILVGFVVAALAVVFSIAPSSSEHSVTLDRVVLQLSLGLLSGTVAALSLTTIAAYPNSSGHRSAAHLLFFAPAVCAISVMAAFEELAVALLPAVSGFLIFVTTCLAGLAVIPPSLTLPVRWSGRISALIAAWLVFSSVLLGKEYSRMWTPSNGALAAIEMCISVAIALTAMVAYFKVAHRQLDEAFPWTERFERGATTAAIAIGCLALLFALLPPGS